MHLHGHTFRIVYGDRLLANDPGIWPLNGTKTFHQSNNGETPGGMITKVIYIK